MVKTATRTTWKNSPIDNPKPIALDLRFTKKQFSRLIIGLIPQEMEDKWLYFHSSWTGYGIYRAEFIKELEYYTIKEFWVERNPKKYGNENDDEDIKTFSFLLESILL